MFEKASPNKIQLSIKFTHNGAVAIFQDGVLIACHEGEKHDNNPRYSEIDLAFVLAVLKAEGYEIGDVDKIVVDGWSKGSDTEFLERNGRKFPVAEYGDQDPYSVMSSTTVDLSLFEGGPAQYTTTTHVGGHLAASYATSPFAAKNEPAYAVMWDGGTIPRLFYIEPGQSTPRFVADLGNLYGSAYSVFPLYFGPFRREQSWLDERPTSLATKGVAGKAMAFAGLGNPSDEMLATTRRLIAESTPERWETPFELAEKLIEAFELDQSNKQDAADAIAAFDRALGESFVERLQAAIREDQRVNKTPTGNICLSGGCALNLRWNTNVRALPEVRDVWVPPFPDDSGGAIGAFMAADFARNGAHAVKWNVYSGPKLLPRRPTPSPSRSTPSPRLDVKPVTPVELGRLLHETGRPILVLHGRAELGPRALGNRSILCAAHGEAKGWLNEAKNRADYRPVAPICLEEFASDVFEPGGSDPYMLFTHQVRDGWGEHIPAIEHLDGTARLQTMNRQQNPVTYDILKAYYEASGIPVLCNTSANYEGKGFFPSAKDAIAWGERVGIAVWSDGVLYGAERFLSPSLGKPQTEITGATRQLPGLTG